MDRKLFEIARLKAELVDAVADKDRFLKLTVVWLAEFRDSSSKIHRLRGRVRFLTESLKFYKQRCKQLETRK